MQTSIDKSSYKDGVANLNSPNVDKTSEEDPGSMLPDNYDRYFTAGLVLGCVLTVVLLFILMFTTSLVVSLSAVLGPLGPILTPFVLCSIVVLVGSCFGAVLGAVFAKIATLLETVMANNENLTSDTTSDSFIPLRELGGARINDQENTEDQTKISSSTNVHGSNRLFSDKNKDEPEVELANCDEDQSRLLTQG